MMVVISACCLVTGITSPSTSKSWACPASPSSLSESHRSVPCLLVWTPFFPPPITTPSQIPERLFLLSSRSCCCCCCCSGLALCRCCSSSSLLLLVSSDLCWFLFCGCCMDGSTCCIHTVAADPGAWEVQLLARPASRRVCSKLISRLFAVQCHKPRLRTFRVACAAWKTYRLCIGSMATLSSVNFKIEVNPFSILRNCALPGLTEAFSDCKTLGSRAELHGLS